MLISTGEINKKKKILGPVYVTYAKTHHAGKHILASIKRVTGGELKEERVTIEETIEKAMVRVQEKAMAIKANAIENLRIETSADVNGVWITVYGTAIKTA